MLESVRALLGLERRAEAARLLQQALAIAEGWDDKSLQDWFACNAEPLHDRLG